MSETMEHICSWLRQWLTGGTDPKGSEIGMQLYNVPMYVASRLARYDKWASHEQYQRKSEDELRLVYAVLRNHEQ